MELRDIWKTLGRPERQVFIARVGTSEGYVEKLCGGHCCPSLEMAEKMISAEPRLTYGAFLKSRKRRARANAQRGRLQG